jgi:hypothetical protein
MKRSSLAGALVAASVAAAGCLTEPPLEERWTKVEIVSASPLSLAEAAADTTTTFSVRARVTYRDIVTGSVIAELRYAAQPPDSMVPLEATDPRLPSAQAIDRILGSSQSLGFSDRLVTGWDHLIHEMDLSVDAAIPAGFGGAPGDTAAAAGAIYLIVYMGDVDEIELASGEDSLVVTPFLTTDREILSAGIDLTPAPAGM